MGLRQHRRQHRPQRRVRGRLTCNGAGACQTTCTADLQCEGGYYCTSNSAGACAATKGRGRRLRARHDRRERRAPVPERQMRRRRVLHERLLGRLSGVHRGEEGLRQRRDLRNIAADTDPDAECAGGLTCNGAGACNSGCNRRRHVRERHLLHRELRRSCATKKTSGTACAGDTLDASGGHQCTSAGSAGPALKHLILVDPFFLRPASTTYHGRATWWYSCRELPRPELGNMPLSLL